MWDNGLKHNNDVEHVGRGITESVAGWITVAATDWFFGPLLFLWLSCCQMVPNGGTK